MYYRNRLSAVASSDSGRPTNELRTALGTSLLQSVLCVLEVKWGAFIKMAYMRWHDSPALSFPASK